jgi:DNA-binding transcriptional ArsR family regulator
MVVEPISCLIPETPLTPGGTMRADEVDPAVPTSNPVSSLSAVLAALADPVRLEMVRRLAAAGEPVACTNLYDGIAKSTASHHFKTLREAGLIERSIINGQTHQRLRRDEVEGAFPGVLDAVVAAAR